MKKKTSNHWTYKNLTTGETEQLIEANIDKLWGFVYVIENKLSGKAYIGKKQFHSRTTKLLPGRTNRKHISKISNWKSYMGSSSELSTAIKSSYSILNEWSFTILEFHTTKGNLSYAEMKLQFAFDVLTATLSDNTKKYYNNAIGSIKNLHPAIIPVDLIKANK
jgi:hypothetical protein